MKTEDHVDDAGEVTRRGDQVGDTEVQEVLDRRRNEPSRRKEWIARS